MIATHRRRLGRRAGVDTEVGHVLVLLPHQGLMHAVYWRHVAHVMLGHLRAVLD